MAKKITGFKTKGMNQDLSVSAFNPEFSFENINLRLSTNEGNTLMSWVNERGTKSLPIVDENNIGINITLQGYPIGTAVLNHQLIVFTTTYTIEQTQSASANGTDFIYRLTAYNDNNSLRFKCKMLYGGDSKRNLNFSTKYPLETLVSFEAEHIQKVYWVDGRNQPRMINVAPSNDNHTDKYTYFSFDFVPELQLKEKVYVEKQFGNGGKFPSGVLQYAMTYYNKYGQESNIFYTTQLLYTSPKDRGGAPDETVDNSFKIVINNVDTNYDYLRIYSILRTSINATPMCRRVQDIAISSGTQTVTYIDTGYNGDTVDPYELLYKGGESVIAGTIEQKGDTLFLGDVRISRPNKNFPVTIRAITNSISTKSRAFYPAPSNSRGYKYGNQLSSIDTTNKQNTVPCGGFCKGDYYRLGVQFQYKNGQWSEPLYLQDYRVEDATFGPSGDAIYIRIIEAKIQGSDSQALLANGYRKVRPVVVYPEIQDRVNKCQGVICPTMYTQNMNNNGIVAQSSWFFRCKPTGGYVVGIAGSDDPVVAPNFGDGNLPYANRGIAENKPEKGCITYSPENLRQVEIQGDFDEKNQYKIHNSIYTFHSPDVEFRDAVTFLDLSNLEAQYIGKAEVKGTLSDINIQTETPTISAKGAGFIHKTFYTNSPHGIVSGLFYDDYFVDDTEGEDVKDSALQAYDKVRASAKWMIYPWQKDGSLNNDINRPSDKGVSTSLLQKKIISNLRYTEFKAESAFSINLNNVELFESNQDTFIKLGTDLYEGNVDTLLVPDHEDGMYFAFRGWKKETAQILVAGVNTTVWLDQETPFNSIDWGKTSQEDAAATDSNKLLSWDGSKWNAMGGAIGTTWMDLVAKKEGVRMKYKSTPHLVINTGTSLHTTNQTYFERGYPVLNIKYKNVDTTFVSLMFGGKSQDALKAHNWIPCGNAVEINNNGYTTISYDWGDTYYQRYDCLKTYAFTREDKNQIVEIGSFPLETRINIDGRYDKNRGQASNLYMSPENFNLINPVYSQLNNFFTYKITADENDEQKYHNQLTWSKAKSSGADVDLWTNVTLGATLELDGDKGRLRKLIRLNDQLLAFQDTGISQILYDENVQVSTQQGVPIEIANSGKVQGKRYYSDTVGCSDKWSITSTPAGIYFMDSAGKDIYLFNGQLANISTQGGFNTWSKKNIPAPNIEWNPVEFNNFVSYYDRKNQDILFINKLKCLVFSEKIGAFTSFYSYENTPYFCNVDDIGIWLKSAQINDSITTQLWQHQSGNYCQFFGYNKPYSITLVGNPEPQADKIFTNLEFRACVDGDGLENDSEFTPYLPFDSLETWNEYQHGIADLENKNGHSAMQHHTLDRKSSLKRKFRIWRCDIPRDNYAYSANETAREAQKAVEASLGIFRNAVRPIDRMRNPWIYLRLGKKISLTETLPKAEIHDFIMTYYS